MSYASVLVDRWAAQREWDGKKPTALGTRMRHSDAAKCARYLGLVALNVPESDGMDLAGVHVTSLGTEIHECWQAALVERYPDAKVEIEPSVGWEDFDASGHLDALVTRSFQDTKPSTWASETSVEITTGIHRTCIELKSMGGTSYKIAVGVGMNGQPKEPGGPKKEHVAQLALNTVAADADEGVLVYMAVEAISKGIAKRCNLDELERFTSEWHFTRAELDPIAADEKARMQAILDAVDVGVLPDRWYDGKVIASPEKVNFPCGYCSQLANCIALGSKATVEDVAVTLGVKP